MITRRELADQIDRLDAEIAELQRDKRELFASYREATSKAECKAAQVAIRKRQKANDGQSAEIEAHDALVDEIFCEITSGTQIAIARGAPRATSQTEDPRRQAVEGEAARPAKLVGRESASAVAGVEGQPSATSAPTGRMSGANVSGDRMVQGVTAGETAGGAGERAEEPAPPVPPAMRVHDHAVTARPFDPDPEMPAFLRRTG